ncbi:MAG: hypothetical protein FWG79_09045 [Bacteroidales bacterium]|nr:hypothetical protein [Bacteroidales bacterium]
MKCYNHPSEDAVVSCQCGRGLCSSCSQDYTLGMPDGTRRIICEECYEHFQEKNAEHKRTLEKERIQQEQRIKNVQKRQMENAFHKYLFTTVWSGTFFMIGLLKTDLSSSSAGFWEMFVAWWAIGGAPTMFIKGFFSWDLHDTINSQGQGGCFYVFLKYLVWFIVACIACPIIFIYSLVQAIRTGKATIDYGNKTVKKEKRGRWIWWLFLAVAVLIGSYLFTTTNKINTTSGYTEKTFSGKFGSNEVSLKITIQPDNDVKGVINLPQNSKKLIGRIDGDSLFLENTDITGYYDGNFKGVIDGKTYRGTYHNPITGRSLSFDLSRLK